MIFYSTPDTLERVQYSNRELIFLVGGFTGYLNFGDVIQLQGAIKLHRERNPECLLLPLIHPSAFGNGVKQTVINDLFKNQDWIFYLKKGEEIEYKNKSPVNQMLELYLEDDRREILVHFYGSGRLNQYWGESTLELLDTILEGIPFDGYLISGQQVSKPFIDLFVEHIKRWNPDLIGCRDRDSVDYLSGLGLNSIYSGDDALDILAELSTKNKPKNKDNKGQVGINFRRAIFTGNQENSKRDPSIQKNTIQSVLENMNVIHSPLYLETFGCTQYQKLEIEDFPYLSRHFPDHERINLVDDLLIKDTQKDHLALYLFFLKVPAYLLAYNDYYQQKQRSLGQLRKFSGELFEVDKIISRQDNWLEENIELRQEWLSSLW